ncbi:MAG: hypothetical protein PHH04_01510 [Thomasclavelia sp.]|nr:hypothetical protein [Thomasclavelia sp.]
MKETMLGNTKIGFKLNNDSKELTCFIPLSFYEKLRHYKSQVVISYDDIKEINLTYGYTSGKRMGSATLDFEVILKDNNKYLVPITFYNMRNNPHEHEDLLDFIDAINESKIKVIDKYNILEKLIDPRSSIFKVIQEIDFKKHHPNK